MKELLSFLTVAVDPDVDSDNESWHKGGGSPCRVHYWDPSVGWTADVENVYETLTTRTPCP